ncbi:unnamed protein product [marine sediment metagenome]|uniref:Uncharacterized protein n=1 Tax=marine sediment metagenome TaxID=412755 RepID=X1C0P8_9ZZZZ
MPTEKNGLEIAFETKENVITFCYDKKQKLVYDVKNYFNLDGKISKRNS